jgi:hypothetical protein
VCGYRSPATNAMLRDRSNGVAEHSQHMLGKAMDFYIPGASLEELRNVGLRLQRGGVGYYPTSGSPFVHLDVGNVRHWGPSISDTEMAKIMSGHAVHVAAATDMHTAAATTDRRVASAPADKHATAATTAPATPAAARGFALASLESKPADRPASAAAASQPSKTTTSSATSGPATSGSATSGTGVRTPDRTKAAASAKAAPSTKAAAPVKTADAEASGVMWPVRVAENDRVPLDMALGYASPQSPETGTAMRPESTGGAPAHIATVAAFKPMPQNGSNAAASMSATNTTTANTTTVAKKTTVRTAALDEGGKDSDRIASEPAANTTVAAAARETDEPFIAPATRAAGGTVTTRVITNPLRYDDPWLRAMIMTPSISDAMTATLYGRPDLSELRNLMHKPRASLMLSFSEDPFSGPAPDQFRGDAVVFMDNHAFDKRTASLH